MSSESSDSATSAPESPNAATEPAAAGEALGPEDCVEVTSARLDLILASTAEDATPPAETMLSYGPPSDVAEAIEHFIETGGAQYDDPDFNEFDGRIESWVAEVCPT